MFLNEENIFTILLVIFICSSYVTFAEEPTIWMPKWNVGDWWVVEYFKYTSSASYKSEKWTGPDKWKFTVKKIITVDNIEQFVLEVINMEPNKDYRGVIYYEKNNLKFVKGEYYVDGKLSWKEYVYYNKYRIYPYPALIWLGPINASVPVFPLEIQKDEKKLEKIYRVEREDETLTQEVEIIDDQKAWSLISERIPEKSTKNITLPKKVGRIQEGVSEEINNVRQIMTSNKILPYKNKNYYCIELTKKYPNYKDVIIKQIWHEESPWPIFTESGINRYFLIEISK